MTARHEPLRVMFFTTSMPVGGAETLLVNLIRQLDHSRIVPELCCLKERGPLGDELAKEIPVHAQFIHHKFDLLVLPRLRRLLRSRQIDAVVTVAAGDNMFWGRLAAKWASIPVICSALHSTGWPDGVGRLNRLLTPITDAVIGVAPPHGRHLVEHEGFPEEKVVVIPNGVDTDQFRPMPDRSELRRELGIADTAPVVGLVAALRPEKNHELFLEVVTRVRKENTDAVFLIVGDGPRRAMLEKLANDLGIARSVKFLGTRGDIPGLLNLFDVNVLTSHVEANPVSILEAMSTATPTVATNVGSVAETVIEGKTGYLVPAGDARTLAQRVIDLLAMPLQRQALGAAARVLVVKRFSLDSMVAGYDSLLTRLYREKTGNQTIPQVTIASHEREQVASIG
ncbi:MAG: glycosyltransferase [Aeoliella sp.]